ncbi:MAG: pyridoxal phosphate-dependent aminotransferase [Candidatus Korobacteraceae bacterium]|jgi:aspartate/methionine/tyrosine aminotransferase
MSEAIHAELRLAQRMSRLGTETAFEVLAKARALEAKGRDIVHLEIGEPDFDTPANIVDAAVDALHGGFTHYGPSAGLPELRKAIADEVGASRNTKVSPDEVVVVPGGKPIIFFTMLALVEEGDEVIYPNPGFPIYESMIEFLGAKAVPIRLREEREFRLDTRELKGLINERTKLIILNSPQNPTGGVMTEQDIEEIAAIVAGHDCMILSDEIYSRLIFEGKHHSLFSHDDLRDRIILLDGFSKTYAMTGWRMGYGVMRTDLAQQIARLMTNSNSCTATFTQKAGIEAILGPQASVDAMNDEFKKRRDYFAERINRIKGFRCCVPKGAFYMFPNITGTGWKSKELADALLDEAGVAALSGTSFGAYGEGYLRFSIANSLENIRKALDRVEAWVAKHV